ncbi:hypothetical protein KC19_4G265500 [Ceratodon purpureus]|uniref:Uncharacterized protein n=1 Tax=Ceratodon purpureus TaxID=3225 RepID=A0A8T0IFD8_CERPU|nr:hypothetical protein KC19_4G265500 [Ceratodon purpureus]
MLLLEIVFECGSEGFLRAFWCAGDEDSAMWSDSDVANDVELLNRMDAECIVQSLTVLPIEQVGSRKWLAQHANLEKLNLQAHYNTMVHCDEFVMLALTSHDKLGLLIQELLVIEIWKEKVLPHILTELAEQSSNINIHLVLYQETTIINLLEVLA